MALAGASTAARTRVSLTPPTVKDSEAVDEVSIGKSRIEFDALEHVETWSRRNCLGQFNHQAIEKAYERYIAQLWVDALPRWTFLVAVIMSLAPIIGEVLSPLFRDEQPNRGVHLSMHRALYGLSVIFWVLTVGLVCLRRCRREWLRAIASQQQRILVFVAFAIGSGLTFPIILASKSEIIAGIPQIDLTAKLFLEGRWQQSLSASAAALYACSGVSPIVFALVAPIIFGIWETRNHVMRLALATVDATEDATVATAANMTQFPACPDWDSGEEGYILSASIMHVVPVFLVTFVVAYQRDSSMRQNFVILQLVRTKKDRAIDTLRGEKEKLESVLDSVHRAQAETHQHIKFVTANTPRPAARTAPTGTDTSHARGVTGHHRRRRRAYAARTAEPSFVAYGHCSQADSRGLSASRGGDRQLEHEARLLRKSEQASEDRAEISNLTQSIDEGHGAISRGTTAYSVCAKHGPTSGRQMEWHSREGSPHLAQQKMLRPTPVKRTPSPACGFARPQASCSPEQITEVTAATVMTHAGQRHATATCAAMLPARGFRLPTEHQKRMDDELQKLTA
mmetsp:Transcript_54173/g.139914  ORF Transcript_54173/g.139914 Transcript_54173/m.139914 type:complete len:568 (+) Transcript_54173:2-1705(+)